MHEHPPLSRYRRKLTQHQLSFFSDSESGPRLLAPLYDRFRQAGTLLRSSEDGSMILQAILDVVVDEALDITEAFRCVGCDRDFLTRGRRELTGLESRVLASPGMSETRSVRASHALKAPVDRSRPVDRLRLCPAASMLTPQTPLRAERRAAHAQARTVADPEPDHRAADARHRSRQRRPVDLLQSTPPASQPSQRCDGADDRGEPRRPLERRLLLRWQPSALARRARGCLSRLHVAGPLRPPGRPDNCSSPRRISATCSTTWTRS